jgi:hypothetical protein
MPSFLTNTIPQIYTTLLALDISANFLGALPPCLAMCTTLEELNIASNPLRVLPVFLADLTSLRVLIADSTGISTLPDTLVDLDKLHTVSVRRNKMNALPSWFCLLPALQTLYVDGNPFQGPWKALVEPLLAKIPMTPLYPLSTPVFPLPSAGNETDGTDMDDFSEPPSSDAYGQFQMSPEEEEQTITPERAHFMRNASTAPINGSFGQERGLSRTRTTPNRVNYDQTRAKSTVPTIDPRSQFASPTTKAVEDSGYLGDHELRKMKSAGDLRRGKSGAASANSEVPAPSRPALSHYATSLSSSNLLNVKPAAPQRPGTAKRFASLGAASALGSSSSSGSRPALTKSLWEGSEDEASNSPESNRVSSMTDNTFTSPKLPSGGEFTDGKNTIRPRHGKEGKEKASRWGFLKKMSMGKLRIDSPPSRLPPSQGHLGSMTRPQTSAGLSSSFVTASASAPGRLTKSPQIDMRFSTTGTLGALAPASSLSAIVTTPKLDNQPSTNAPKAPSTIPSPNLLAPPSLPRSSKRRSFLPIDTPLSLNIPIPEASTFIAGVTVTNGADDLDSRKGTPSPVIDSEQYLRREEERAREGYMRALRSVMAYLKDMNDLGLSQQPSPISLYGSSTDEVLTTRSRRPTAVEGSREVSMALSGSTVVSSDSGQLRSTESMAGLRDGSGAQTLSVATTDSNGSDERKFKDDKGKRAMVVREIVAYGKLSSPPGCTADG